MTVPSEALQKNALGGCRVQLSFFFLLSIFLCFFPYLQSVKLRKECLWLCEIFVMNFSINLREFNGFLFEFLWPIPTPRQCSGWNLLQWLLRGCLLWSPHLCFLKIDRWFSYLEVEGIQKPLEGFRMIFGGSKGQRGWRWDFFWGEEWHILGTLRQGSQSLRSKAEKMHYIGQWPVKLEVNERCALHTLSPLFKYIKAYMQLYGKCNYVQHSQKCTLLSFLSLSPVAAASWGPKTSYQRDYNSWLLQLMGVKTQCSQCTSSAWTIHPQIHWRKVTLFLMY